MNGSRSSPKMVSGTNSPGLPSVAKVEQTFYNQNKKSTLLIRSRISYRKIRRRQRHRENRSSPTYDCKHGDVRLF